MATQQEVDNNEFRWAQIITGTIVIVVFMICGSAVSCSVHRDDTVLEVVKACYEAKYSGCPTKIEK